MKKNIEKKSTYKIVGIILLALLVFWGFNNSDKVSGFFSTINSFLSPIYIGILIAFIVNMVMRSLEQSMRNNDWGKLEEKKPKLIRPISLILSYLIFLVIIVLIIFLVVPDLARTVSSFIQDLPQTLSNLSRWFDSITIHNPNDTIGQFFRSSALSFNDIVQKFLNWLSGALAGISSAVISWVQSFISGIIKFFIGFVFSIYFLLFKEELTSGFKKLGYSILPEAWMDKLIQFFSLVQIIFSKFFIGQSKEALILGTLTFLSMVIFGFPYKLTIGVTTGFGAFIPYIGALLPGFIGALFIAVEEGIWRGLAFVVLIIVVQQIENNFIYPKVVGGQVGLPSLWAFTAVIYGSAISGLAGTVLAVPVATIIYVLITAWTNKRVLKKKIDPDKYRLRKEYGKYTEKKWQPTANQKAMQIVNSKEDFEKLDLDHDKDVEEPIEAEDILKQKAEKADEKSDQRYKQKLLDLDSVGEVVKEDLARAELIKKLSREHPTLSKRQIEELIPKIKAKARAEEKTQQDMDQKDKDSQ